MASESHSEQFGLDPKENPGRTTNRGPGSAIPGTTGDVEHNDSVVDNAVGETQSKLAGVATGSSGNAVAGSGSSVLEPSQGSNKMGDESGGLLSKGK